MYANETWYWVIGLNTQNIIIELRSRKENISLNQFKDSEIIQDIEHEIDIQLEDINDMIEAEK